MKTSFPWRQPLQAFEGVNWGGGGLYPIIKWKIQGELFDAISRAMTNLSFYAATIDWHIAITGLRKVLVLIKS